ncbi:MAG: RecX family transcriptional regulator [Flavobacteriales bacterium]|nr:RecX family transcriptional regulator [Flavobacteriales bacterium]|tara:strand:- start:8036 stop:8479 length:444 start_codon:yes stop_codon:yes gene_type:complete
MTQKEALQKMAKYCAYQERCQSEVRQKLKSFSLCEEEIESIICELIDQNFLNEERFAKAFVRGKFNQKDWGKNKIKQHLFQKEISAYCIKKGLEEINESDYLNKLERLVYKKKRTLKFSNQFNLNQKVARYLIGKGFESDLVWDYLR